MLFTCSNNTWVTTTSKTMVCVVQTMFLGQQSGKGFLVIMTTPILVGAGNVWITIYIEFVWHTISYGPFCCQVGQTPWSTVITPLISFQTCQPLGQQILMLFCLHLKTGRNLVPTGQTPDTFTHPSNLCQPRKGLHKPPSNNWWSWSVLPRRPKCLFRINQHLHQYLNTLLWKCQTPSSFGWLFSRNR